MRDVRMSDLRSAAQPLLPALPYKAWLPWIAVPKDNGKMDKIPTSGTTTNAPNSWLPFDSALEDLTTNHKVAGIGFAITAGIISLDYDNCRDSQTGDLTDEAQVELERFGSYAYVTPSGRGFRIVGYNSRNNPLPGRKRTVRLPGGTSVEIFIGPTNHFNTFTHEVIEGYTELKDISSETLDYLSGLPGEEEERKSGTEPQRSIEAIRAALKVIPNDRKNWDYWCYVGMASWRASGGSEEGLEAWRAWSSKHDCHDDKACDERWRHWFKSPPTKLGFGTLYHLARQANPLFVAPFDPVVDLSQSGKVEPHKPQRPAILHLEDVESLPPPEWLIDGLFPEGGLFVTYGAPKGGKTFIILSAGLHIAANREWFGRKVKSGCVVYIAGEGIGGLGTRLKAMRSLYKIPSNIPFFVIPRAVNFTKPDAASDLVKLVRDTVGDEPIALVIIDTLARAMPGADENSAQEVGLVIAACDEIRQDLSCAVCPIHHQGKDATRGLRGTSAIHGAIDASFRVSKSGKTVTVKNEDQKEAECAPDLNFEMVEVAVGIGRSSLVPVLTENATEGDMGDIGGHLPQMSQLGMQALTEALASKRSAVLPPLDGLPSGRGVDVEVWREEFYNRLPAHNYQAKKKAFQRIVADLQRRKQIGTKSPWVWKAEPTSYAENA